MNPAPVALWTLRRGFPASVLVAWLAAALALWALGAVLGPVGIAAGSGREGALFYEVAFLGALAGTFRGLAALSEAAWFLSRVAPQRRLIARAVGLATCATAGASLGLLPGLLLGRSLHFHPIQLSLAAAWAVARLVALGLLLLRLPAPAAARGLALCALTWFLPAALSGTGRLSASLRQLLDAAGPLRDPQGFSSAGALLTLAALFGAAALLELRPRPRAPQTSA